MAGPQLITAVGELPPSPARTRPAERAPLRLGAVQERWHADPAEHRAALGRGIAMAAGEGAQVVCLQELTLSSYAAPLAEPLDEDAPGATLAFARDAAREHGIHVHASLYERAGDGGALGFNTAILVAPDGTLAGRTRKVHIPASDGYGEDRFFRPAPAEDAFPVHEVAGARLGLPTCYDQWFPELARAYALAGADVLVYPTAIGSEPAHPGLDTQPQWEQVIVAAGIANGAFMVAVNRTGDEPPLSFYGSSFISDPYGRTLVQAPRDAPAVLVADLDLDQRRDWLELFPLLERRRPDAYAPLVEPVGSAPWSAISTSSSTAPPASSGA